MRFRNIILAFLITITLSGSGHSQGAVTSNGPIPTVEDLLRKHHIALTRAAVVDALKNDDPEVRWLAAHKLVDDGATESIPAIAEALAQEQIPATQVNLAYALARFKEEKGFAALLRICHSKNFS